jgi:uncharacterized protein
MIQRVKHRKFALQVLKRFNTGDDKVPKDNRIAKREPRPIRSNRQLLHDILETEKGQNITLANRSIILCSHMLISIGLTRITGYGEFSIRVNDIIVRDTGVIALPQSFLIWGAKRPQDITIESLLPLYTFFPAFEVLLIGYGENSPSRPLIDIMNYMRSKGTIVEVSRTATAASTFNVLNAEGRHVAAALIPNKERPEGEAN